MANNEVVETVKSWVDTVVTTGVSGVNSVVNEWFLATDRVVNESMRMIELATPYAITFVSAVLIYIIGKFIAGILRRLVLKVLKKTGFDNIVAKSGANKLKEAAGIQASFSEIFSNIVYYIVYISVIIAVLEKLGFNVVTDAMTDLVAYIPSIIVALIIIIIGTMISNFIKEVVTRISETGGLSYSKTLGNVAYSLSMVFIFLIAIQQLQIDISILTNNLTLVIATFCFIIAVAGSFATKSIATNILATTYLKNNISKGDTIEVGDVSGKIIDITSTNIVVEGKWGKVYLPSDSVFNGTYTVK